MTANERLLNAVAKILTPVVRILLRRGIPSDAVTEIVRKTYVEVAERDFALEGRKQTLSRISVITGLNRKEVSRLKRLPATPDSDSAMSRNRAATVLGAWLRDPEFLDSKGDPEPLRLSGPSPNFGDLVRKHSGDMKPRAVADELLRVGAIEMVDRKYRMTARGYVPASDPEHLIEVLGEDGAEFLATIEHNIEHGANDVDDARFQRKVLYDNVPPEFVDEFKSLSGRLSQHLLEELDRWLAARDVGGDARRDQNVTLGLGAYQIVRDNSGEPDDGETDEEV